MGGGEDAEIPLMSSTLSVAGQRMKIGRWEIPGLDSLEVGLPFGLTQLNPPEAHDEPAVGGKGLGELSHSPLRQAKQATRFWKAVVWRTSVQKQSPILPFLEGSWFHYSKSGSL